MEKTNNNHSYSVIKDYIAGTLSGIVARLLDYPLDTIKVLQQINPGVYKNMFDCAKITYKKFGIIGFYRGITSPMISSSLENSALFSTYGFLRRIQGVKPDDSNLKIHNVIISAVGASCITSTILTPFELLKCRMQMLQSARDRGVKVNYRGPFDVLVKMVKQEGLMSLYRGHIGTLCREIPGNIGWFGSYELISRAFLKPGQTKKDLKVWQTMIQGSCSGFSYWTIFYPADTVKSRIQTDVFARNKSFIQVLKMIYYEERFHGLYRGWAVTALRASYSHAFVFVVYSKSVQLFNYLYP